MKQWDRLYRTRDHRMVGGVLGGISEKTGVSAPLLRIIYVIFTVTTGIWSGVLLYVLAMVIIPEEPADGVVFAPTPPAPPAPRPPAPRVPQPPAV